MAYFLVHYVANDAERDYDTLSARLRRLAATQLTEELWLVESELSLRDVTEVLFSDRPFSDRFFVTQVHSDTAWSAANLLANPREIIQAQRFGRKSVKVYRQGYAPRRLETEMSKPPSS